MRHAPIRTDLLRRLVAAVMLVVLVVLAMPAPAAGVRDDRGRSVEPLAPPQRIVSLVPSLTETVCALQACARLVGVDRFSNWPAQVDALPRLGGLEDAQVERIVALKPDLVLATPSARVVERLEGLGLKVLALEAKNLADTRRVLESVARALGAPGAGEALWRGVEARVAAAAAHVPSALHGKRVYFEIAATPHAAGEASFVGELLARLHLGNIVPAALGPFPQLNPEFVVRAQPDLVMATEQNLAEMPRRPGWSALRALQARSTCGFALERFDLLVRPGPRLGEAAEILADCLVGVAARERKGR